MVATYPWNQQHTSPKRFTQADMYLPVRVTELGLHLPHTALCPAFQCCTWHALEQYCGPLQRPQRISCSGDAPQLVH